MAVDSAPNNPIWKIEEHMQLTFLGTGDCAGVPVYNCSCQACVISRREAGLRRNQSCGLLASGRSRVLIDAGLTDLGRRFTGKRLDGILLSHYHIDHVYGLFPMRWGTCRSRIPVYGPDFPPGCADLLSSPGVFDFSRTLAPFTRVAIGDLQVTTLPLNHSKPSLGFLVESDRSRLAWMCDTCGLPESALDILRRQPPDLLVLDCTFPPLDSPNTNHNDIRSAIELHLQTGVKRTCLTHIGHTLDLWLQTSGFKLPRGVTVAHDGMVLRI